VRNFKNILGIFAYLACLHISYAQNNRIEMLVVLNPTSQSFNIEQKITYINSSQDTLNSIYLHDWNNAFSDKNTTLGKRFLENYNKKFCFAKDADRGATTIYNITSKLQILNWERPNKSADFVQIFLKNALFPNDTVTILLNYKVKVPNAKFTSYGIEGNDYKLRYWHIVPAVYDKTWQLMHHLDMDDLYQKPTNYNISLQVPKTYNVTSNLLIQKISEKEYKLTGENIQDFQLNLSTTSHFDNFQTKEILVSTNLNNIEIDEPIKQALLERQLVFLKQNLGKFPHKKIFISKVVYDKNPLYGINQLPSFLRPFSDTFMWDLRMFKALTQQYIDNSLLSQTRKDTWLRNGMHTFLMMQYVDANYPEIKLLGGLSKIWGIRSYQFSKLDFNDKYDFVYQYTTRSNNDQALTTASDSLTNFNRLIFTKYKAGLALQYLNDYLGDSLVNKAIKYHFENNTLKNDKKTFKKYITTAPNKDTSWFFDTFIQTNKKIDYSIKKLKNHNNKDSISFYIKNRRNVSAPISFFALNKDSVLSKTWFTAVDSTKKITVAKHQTSHWVLNYDNMVPEINRRNNTELNKWALIKKPLKIRWLRDAEAPNYTQLFIEPKADYNFYDGVIAAISLKNKSAHHKNFIYSITPAYSFKSQSLTGSFKVVYHKYLENNPINSYRLGLAGSYFHYQPELAYKKLVPYAQIFFKRKNLRSVKNSSVSIGYTMVDKEIDVIQTEQTDFDKYNILNINYTFKNPEIIDNFSFSSDLEFGSKFSKLSADIRFRKLTDNNQQFDARFFAGVFFHNESTTDYFSFGVNRPHDYLFRYRYYGREETSGIFSQQIIINDGGFKAQMPVSFANQWITSFNTSIGIWRWFEIYNDVGLVKNHDTSVYFVHDKGVRLNFIHNILEVYFPLHSNNGWDIAQPHYEENIRFVFSADMGSIYSFLRRGFL